MTGDVKLTAAQRRALTECLEGGELFRSATNLWRWLRILPNGQAYQAASNPTVWVLTHSRGFFKEQNNRVTLTDAGRAALAERGRT